MELLREILQAVDCGLVLVGHDMGLVGELTERILVMHRGQIVKDLSSADFLCDERLSSSNGLACRYRLHSRSAVRER